VIAIRSAAESHTGYVRTNNEDLAVISSDLAAIADGMGGHLGGEVAARTAIEELVDAFQRDRTAAGLVAAVRKANRAIWRKSRVDRKLHGMGTTLTAAALLDAADEGSTPHLALVNVGDSRAYRVDRSDSEHPRLVRLTEDHSVVEEMVRQGELTPAEAAVHPHRHVLTRALGIDSEVDVDVWDLEPVPGTRYLLCSDGLSDEVPEDEIARVLGASEDPSEAAKELVGVALGHGGIDNVTVVVIDVVDADPAALDQPLEMVPPRPSMPDQGDDRFSPDITQALPITRPRRQRGGVREAAEEAAGGAAVAGAAAAAADAAAAIEGAPADPAGADPDSTIAMAAPSSSLYDVEADEGEPTVKQGAAPEEGAPEAGAGAAGAGAGAAAGAAAGVAGAAAATAGTARSTNGHRRSARSMTVRAAAPMSDLADPAHERTMHRPATVLVPTRRLARQYRDRVFTFRVFIFLVLLAALIAGAIAVVIWFQRSSYYVGLAGDRISIYSGRPGGLLWFKPQLIETSQLTTHDLLPNSVVELRHGISESSYAAAKQEVAALTRLSTALGLNPSAPTTTTTTTTFLPSTTTAPSTTAAPTTAPPSTAAPTTTQPPATSTTLPVTSTTGK
jgi:serine/threonine protein phosphatase PrpC